eukprot:2047991-Ditylum_brightwellii.AAC.1
MTTKTLLGAIVRQPLLSIPLTQSEGFDKLLKGAMDTVNDEEKEDSPATEKDHLSNCWKLPPRLVYSKFSSSGSETQLSTLSGNTNSISSIGDPVTQLADYAIIQRANKQLT